MWILAVLACVGGSADIDTVGDTDTAAAEDTDTGDTDGEAVPAFSLVGEWSLTHFELLPEDAALYPNTAEWARSLSAEDFPDYEPCMGDIVNVDQGFVFELDGGLIRRFDLEVATCSGDGLTEDHTIYVEYGSWAFAGADPEEGDLYTINGSRTWQIYPVANNYRVWEGEAWFTLRPY